MHLGLSISASQTSISLPCAFPSMPSWHLGCHISLINASHPNPPRLASSSRLRSAVLSTPLRHPRPHVSCSCSPLQIPPTLLPLLWTALPPLPPPPSSPTDPPSALLGPGNTIGPPLQPLPLRIPCASPRLCNWFSIWSTLPRPSPTWPAHCCPCSSPPTRTRRSTT